MIGSRGATGLGGIARGRGNSSGWRATVFGMPNRHFVTCPGGGGWKGFGHGDHKGWEKLTVDIPPIPHRPVAISQNQREGIVWGGGGGDRGGDSKLGKKEKATWEESGV